MSARTRSSVFSTVLMFAAVSFAGNRFDSSTSAAPLDTAVTGKIHPALLGELDQGPGPVKAWVFFKDKGVNTAEEYEAAVREVAASYNPRATQRRVIRGLRARRGQPIFDEHDLPVVQAYVDAVTDTGAQLHVTSRWVNAVSVYATRSQIEAIAALPCVVKLQPVARAARITPPVPDKPVDEPAPMSGRRSERGLDYGRSYEQLAQINLIALHEQGYTGQGVIVGILDTGFERSHEAFNYLAHPLNVIAEYDFVDDDPDTQQEPGDPSGQHSHGTMILGCLGAYLPGELIGGASSASFVLAKTEDTTAEYPAEEDNYVAGLEFIEANGADMSTSSLGYIDWYTQDDLDGMTAVTTIAVNILTSHGVHHCNAAGNEYHDSDPSTSSLIAPSDGFQVIACGAVDSSGYIASFSSDGPTADGRVKPELLALGVGTDTVDPYSSTGYTTASGTSLSTPLVACAVACLTQAKPYWTVDQMRQHLFETATDYVAYGTYDPLYVRGYGLVDAYAAYDTCSDAGVVTLDGSKYACESTANIVVNDCGLNTDNEVIEYVVVDVESDSEPGVEQVTLTEAAPDAAEFLGSIDLSESDSADVLLVSHGDTVTVTYIDADDGQGGFDVVVTAEAVVDCLPPQILDVQTVAVEPRSAIVLIDADEPVRGTVHYGLSCAVLTDTVSGSGYATSASVGVADLDDDTTYYYAVDAEDEAGNVATDDNGGFCYSFTTPEIPDFFTQEFGAGNDLDDLSLIFTPNESPDFYVGCVEPITELPTDPTDGTVLTMSSADTFATVTLTGGATVWLYGVGYGSFYVGSNGYITFNSGDSDYTESLEDHFDQPRISALFDDLDPSSGGTVSWKQLADRVAVTWENVPEWSTSDSNTFQIEMFFDGLITINYLSLDASDGLAGLSEGEGLSPDYYVTDLSDMGACVALTIELPEGTPWRVDPAMPTTMSVQIDDGGETVLPDSAMLHYRFDGGEFLTNQMSHLGGNVYEATLPAAFCGQTPEFYFAATGDGGTTLYNPADAPASYYSAVVASMTVLVDDDFETDQGWTVVDDPSVESGTWERGLPADDGTEGDPLSDFDGSGQCYLTGNSPGNSDVDGGPTMLLSPVLDLADAENPVVRYARWWSNDDQDGDPFDVEVSNDGGQSWALIERAADVPAGWIERTAYLADYTTPSSQTQVRFSASDVPNNSKDEGGLDAVQVFDLGCLGPGTGDYDLDGDVDLADYGAFQLCYNGPAAGECLGAFEFVGNGQIDLDDLAKFVPVLTGPTE